MRKTILRRFLKAVKVIRRYREREQRRDNTSGNFDKCFRRHQTPPDTLIAGSDAWDARDPPTQRFEKGILTCASSASEAVRHVRGKGKLVQMTTHHPQGISGLYTLINYPNTKPPCGNHQYLRPIQRKGGHHLS